MNKENMVHIHNGILLSHKKNKTMPFLATWMELDTLILSEVSQKEKDIPYDITYIWNLTYDTNEASYRKENHGLGEHTCSLPRGRGREWDGLGVWG